MESCPERLTLQGMDPSVAVRKSAVHVVGVRRPARRLVERPDELHTAGWPALGTLVRWQMRLSSEGGAKPSEVLQSVLGADPPESTRYARTALWGLREELPFDPMASPPAPEPTTTTSLWPAMHRAASCNAASVQAGS